MIDLSEELETLSTTKKGKEMKLSIISALKKLGDYFKTGYQEKKEEWNFTRPVTFTDFTYEAAGWETSHTVDKVIYVTASGKDVNQQSKVVFFDVEIKDNKKIVLHGKNGTYIDVYVCITYSYKV